MGSAKESDGGGRLSTVDLLIKVHKRLASIDIERKNRLLKVCYVPVTSVTFLAFFLFFLAVAINSTNETNKAGSTCR